MNLSLPNIIVIVILGLAGIGFYGLLISRNLIRVIVCLQVATKGAILAFVIAAKLSGKLPLGQSIALTVIVADTIVAVVALALAVQARRLFGTLDLEVLSRLRR
jgi:NADH-quinone oxidoreductase subunit K